MPLLAGTRFLDRAVPGSGTLMERCLEAGLPLASSCSGQGACGRCAVEVVEGGSALTPPSSREAQALLRDGIGAPWRLACQCRILNDEAPVRIRTGYW